METHISWILLTGSFAYKIKKPVDLGFLDFTQLEKRHFYCEEELRINKRLAPELYLELVTITGTPESPRLNGAGAVIEYAVKMKQFPQEARLDHVLARGELTSDCIEELAVNFAAFHQQNLIAAADSQFGTSETVYRPVAECFAQLRALMTEPESQHLLSQLETWCQAEHARLHPIFTQRKSAGFIRECHGDAHLANMVLLNGHPTLFDAIEFSENLRWIDVMNDVAFTVMDLEDRQAFESASIFLNRYLECSGDYSGLSVLRFYQVYRALVRAKVTAIRLQQGCLSAHAQEELKHEISGYLKLADKTAQPKRPVLMITHGLSGSGKTTRSQQICRQYCTIRIRTDIERKRRFGLQAQATSSPPLKAEMYSTQTTQQLYQDLAALAAYGLQNGYSMIVDGTFLKREQRALFKALAVQQKIPFMILDMTAPEAILRERIAKRKQDASEADWVVLEQQIQTQEALTQEEQKDCVRISD